MRATPHKHVRPAKVTSKDKGESRGELDGLVRDAGGRATPARAAVLGLLRAAPQPLSHRDVEEKLTAQGQTFDRVTLYRALEWLEANSLAHKVAGEDRIWRFAGRVDAHPEHAHFQCRACGSTVCLDEVAPPPTKAPRGYRVESAALTLRGLCPACKD